MDTCQMITVGGAERLGRGRSGSRGDSFGGWEMGCARVARGSRCSLGLPGNGGRLRLPDYSLLYEKM